jgi:hypothetical protein
VAQMRPVSAASPRSPKLEVAVLMRLLPRNGTDAMSKPSPNKTSSRASASRPVARAHVTSKLFEAATWQDLGVVRALRWDGQSQSAFSLLASIPAQAAPLSVVRAQIMTKHFMIGALVILVSVVIITIAATPSGAAVRSGPGAYIPTPFHLGEARTFAAVAEPAAPSRRCRVRSAPLQ